LRGASTPPRLRLRGLEDWRAFEREILAEEAPAQPVRPKPTRTRRPSLESRVRQLVKAGQAVGVQFAVSVEGDKVTASPTRGVAPADPAPADEVEAWIKKQAVHAR
jgi:hypothetical protein